MAGTARAVLSESVQMYLVTIARLRETNQPVPLSQLAQQLSVSPVSVNEMCRKLQDQGFVVYRPYRGASLTPEGERRAHYILRRHRLWEVFLVEHLGLAYAEAHQAACQLEHSTPNEVANRLEALLGHPSVSPTGEPIPKANGELPERIVVPLAGLAAGQQGHVVRCEVSDADRAFLDEQGVHPGGMLMVLATAEGSLLVDVGGERISLARTLAQAIQVEPQETPKQDTEGVSIRPTLKKERSRMEPKRKGRTTQMPLHEMRVGQRGVVVRVGGKGPARQRMMDMGLVPGTEVRVVRVAPLGDPVEFEVKGYSLSLRKNEAKEITVELTKKTT